MLRTTMAKLVRGGLCGLWTLACGVAFSADIVWVHEMRGGGDADPDTFNGPDVGQGQLLWEDDQWRELLESNGHTIVAHDWFNELENDSGQQLNELNAADLVIVSRDTNSGNYDDDPIFEILTWNEEVQVPLLLMTPYIARSSRWDWVPGTPIVNSTGNMVASDTSHDIFANVPLDANESFEFHMQILSRPNPDTGVIDGDNGEFGEDNIDLLDADFGPNAEVLAVDEAGVPWIALWENQNEFYPGSLNGGIPGNTRMFLSAGSDYDEFTWGEKNITRAGDQLVLNAIAYLTGEEAPILPIDNTDVCGDFDRDGDVDSADRTIQTTGWTGALQGEGSATFETGDCDADGDVDTADQNGLIQNWTGAQQAGNLTNGNDADLWYDPATGNVTIDASDTASGSIISFVLATDSNDMRPENFQPGKDAAAATAGPFIDVGTNTDATTFQIGQTDPLSMGAGPRVNLGDILPAGINSPGALAEYLTLADYASALGVGGQLDLRIVPEPSGGLLLVMGVIAFLRRRR